MLQPKNEGLTITLDKIKKNAIMLPDFQRQFVWKDEEAQRKLVASVLTKMPIGSILLLKAESANEYACKSLGTQKPIPAEQLPSGNVEFLLDGQQRMTVLANVFSDVIFELAGSVSNLIAPSALKRRFFLALPDCDNVGVQDLFGLRDLVFPLNNPDSDEPEFLSSDILPFIRAISFNVGKDADKYLNPYSKPPAKMMSELQAKCAVIEDGFYYIPLYLLIENSYQLCHITLQRIVEDIANKVKVYKVNRLIVMLNEEENPDIETYIKNNCTKIMYDGYFDESCYQKTQNDIRDEFSVVLQKQADIWVNQMVSYLKSCVTQISLSQISLDASQRARAIDIYENLNRGGVSLDIFDLLMARVAQVTTEPFYDRLQRNISKYTDYSPSKISSVVVKKSFNSLNVAGTYHAAERMCCYLTEKNEFQKIYLDAFLNVLSFLCYVPDFKPGAYTIDYLKRPKKLSLKADDINNNTDISCEALDRACFFFQSRCGIRTIKDINYSLMIPIVAYVLSDDSCYSNDDVFNLLEAWYWTSIFAGTYDKDQNQTMINDLNRITANVLDILNKKKPDTKWLKDRTSHILKMQGFSDLPMLIMDNAKNDEYPKSVLTNTICQYFLAKGYDDLMPNKNGELYHLNVFESVSNNLQIHHVVPLGSTTIGESTKSIRNDKTHYLNSPLNMMYITDGTNIAISSKSLSEYSTLIPAGAGLTNLCFGAVNIDATSDDNARKAVLTQRYTGLRSNIMQHVNSLLV